MKVTDEMAPSYLVAPCRIEPDETSRVPARARSVIVTVNFFPNARAMRSSIVRDRPP